MNEFYKMHPQIKRVDVSHGGRQCSISILGSINKNTLGPQRIGSISEEVLHIANLFIGSRSKATQTSLWNIINDLNNSTILFPTNDVEDKIDDVVSEALNKIIHLPGMSMEDIHTWNVRNVNIPSSVKEDFVKSSMISGHTKEQTYLKSEYPWLTSLATVMKVFFPIIFMYQDFCVKAYSEKAGKRMKDKYMYSRIAYKLLPREIRNNPGFIKLSGFANRSSGKQQVGADQVLGSGVTSETKEDFVVSMLLVMKLSLCTVMNSSGKKNLVSHLYSAIDQIFRVDKRSSIKTKTMGDGSLDTDDSLTELYKDKETSSIPDQVTMLHVVKLNNILPHFRGIVPINKVKRLHKCLLSNVVRPTVLQEYLLSSIFRNVASTSSFDIMDTDAFKGLCALGSYMIRDRHPYLSLILLSGYETKEDEISGLDVPIPNNQMYWTVDKKLVQELHSLYPFFNSSVRIDITTRHKIKKERHCLTKFIDKLVIGSWYEWTAFFTDEQKAFYGDFITDNNRLKKHPAFMTDIHNFLIDLDNIGRVSNESFNKALKGELEI